MIDKYVIDSIMFNQLIEEVTVANPPLPVLWTHFFFHKTEGVRVSHFFYTNNMVDFLIKTCELVGSIGERIIDLPYESKDDNPYQPVHGNFI